MRTLCYRSHALIGGSPGVPNSPVAALVTHAAARNARLDITGALLLEHDRFVQVIEGPAPAIATLYADICADTRHTGIELIWHRDATGRDFPNWSMLALDVLAPELAFILAGNSPIYPQRTLAQLRLMRHLAAAPEAAIA